MDARKTQFLSEMVLLNLNSCWRRKPSQGKYSVLRFFILTELLACFPALLVILLIVLGAIISCISHHLFLVCLVTTLFFPSSDHATGSYLRSLCVLSIDLIFYSLFSLAHLYLNWLHWHWDPNFHEIDKLFLVFLIICVLHYYFLSL